MFVHVEVFAKRVQKLGMARGVGETMKKKKSGKLRLQLMSGKKKILKLFKKD